MVIYDIHAYNEIHIKHYGDEICAHNMWNFPLVAHNMFEDVFADRVLTGMS